MSQIFTNRKYECILVGYNNIRCLTIVITRYNWNKVTLQDISSHNKIIRTNTNILADTGSTVNRQSKAQRGLCIEEKITWLLKKEQKNVSHWTPTKAFLYALETTLVTMVTGLLPFDLVASTGATVSISIGVSSSSTNMNFSSASSECCSIVLFVMSCSDVFRAPLFGLRLFPNPY